RPADDVHQGGEARIGARRRRVEVCFLRLDSLGITEYVGLHGVCSSFIRCLGRESHNGWLGNPSAGSQPTLAESRHLSHFHRQPYCLCTVNSKKPWCWPPVTARGSSR